MKAKTNGPQYISGSPASFHGAPPQTVFPRLHILQEQAVTYGWFGKWRRAKIYWIEQSRVIS